MATLEGKETHLISLFGHFYQRPESLEPETVIYTAQEEAVAKVCDVMHQNKGKIICPVFLGENRQATLIGGKQLPRDPKKHGRHLDAKAFESLLKKYPRLVLMDCNTIKSRIRFDEKGDTNYKCHLITRIG